MLLHRRTPTGWRDVRWQHRLDGLPGRHERARPGHAHRPADRRGDPLHEPGADADARVERAARARRHPEGAPPAVPARVLRRDAAARDDRARAGLRARADHRRRADDGARRHDAGPDPAAARGAPPRPRPGAAPDHPRSLGHRRDLRSRRDHVRGSDRRACPGRRHPRVAAASVHRAPAARDSRTSAARARSARRSRARRRTPARSSPAAASRRAATSPSPTASRARCRCSSITPAARPAASWPSSRERRRALRGPRAPRHVPARAPSAGASRRRRRSRMATRRDARARRRVGLRQVDARARPARARAPERRQHHVRGKAAWTATCARCAAACS